MPSEAGEGHDWGKKLELCRGESPPSRETGVITGFWLLYLEFSLACHTKGLQEGAARRENLLNTTRGPSQPRLRWCIEPTHLLFLPSETH